MLLALTMSYQVFARKYRPQSFDEVVGQDPTIKTLKNAITQNRLHHAYLFCGARGVGKTSIARIFAKSINCEKGPTTTPCQTCESCLDITKSKSLNVLEIDGASNTGVDDIRELREQAKYLPTSGTYKIYIIDEVHMLSTSAFNALLKILEEPPAHIIFMFATTEPHKIPITILSRTQKFDLKKLSTKGLIDHLKVIGNQEELKLEEEAYYHLARLGAGSVRDSLSLLDQVVSFCGNDPQTDEIFKMLGLTSKEILHNMLRALLNQNIDEALGLAQKIYSQGYDVKIFTEEMIRYFRDMMIYKETGDKYLELSDHEINLIKELSADIETTSLLYQFQILNKGISEIAYSDFPDLVFETLIIKIIKAGEIIPIEEIISSLDNPSINLEKKKPKLEEKPEIKAKNSSTEEKKPPKPQEISSKDKKCIDLDNWYLFFDFIQLKNPRLAAILGQSVPVRIENHHIDLGFEKDSIYQDMLKDRLDDLITQAYDYFGEKIKFNLVIKEEKSSILSPLDKKTLEEKRKIAELEKETLAHPMIKKAEEILGTKVKEVKILKSIGD
jgi:DNA polymerase-3 subunit gamma/tau